MTTSLPDGQEPPKKESSSPEFQSPAGPPLKSALKITSKFDSDDDLPLLSERQGDVISAHRALLTLAKGFVGTGCLSLPYAWKEGGLWVCNLNDHKSVLHNKPFI